MRKVFLALAITWMAVIFIFSSRTAELSSGDSSRVGLFICTHFVPGFEDMEESAQIRLLERIDYPIRKGAHAFEYFLLSILLSLALDRLRLSWLIATLYAMSDEIHQYFVPGRTAAITDVLVDSSGALLGVILLFLLFRLFKRKKLAK